MSVGTQAPRAALHALAQANFSRHLVANPYPGRGLVLGRAESGASWLQVYWIMGRSDNSRNRVFVADGSELRTEAADPAKLADPTLIIYEAMLELPGAYLVSNGDQTRTAFDVMEAGGRFEDALEMREREPDAPNYTPRISGLIDLRLSPPSIALSILKASAADPSLTDRTTFRPRSGQPRRAGGEGDLADRREPDRAAESLFSRSGTSGPLFRLKADDAPRQSNKIAGLARPLQILESAFFGTDPGSVIWLTYARVCGHRNDQIPDLVEIP
jgi:hypothetical protein